MSIDDHLKSRTEYGWTDQPPLSCNVLTRPVREIVGRLAPTSILDAGCGNGALAGALAADGYSVIGVDADASGIAAARRLFPAVEFKRGKFDEMPPGSFDVVVSTEVIEHLYAPHELAEYAFAALKPGGHFIISTPYHGFAKNLALSLVNGWDNHFTAHWCGGHIKFFSRKTLSTLLREAGFEGTDFRGVGRLPYLWMSMIVVARRPQI